MVLPGPSKAQERMISEVREAVVRYDQTLVRWVVLYEGRQYVGYGCDWFILTKQLRYRRVGKSDANELNEFVTYALIERTVREKQKDPLF